MQQIYAEQAESADGIINRLEYRPLEGFIFAIILLISLLLLPIYVQL